jgi:hypothetical protein
MYWNFVAIDGVIENQINTQQDATLKGKKNSIVAFGWRERGKPRIAHSIQSVSSPRSEESTYQMKSRMLPLDQRFRAVYYFWRIQTFRKNIPPLCSGPKREWGVCGHVMYSDCSDLGSTSFPLTMLSASLKMEAVCWSETVSVYYTVFRLKRTLTDVRSQRLHTLR